MLEQPIRDATFDAIDQRLQHAHQLLLSISKKVHADASYEDCNLKHSY